MISQHFGRAVAGLVAILACLACGCEEKVTAENFDAITIGMSLTEVEGILGAGTEETASGVDISAGGIPDIKTSDQRVFLWESGGSRIVVTFDKGKVVTKSSSGL